MKQLFTDGWSFAKFPAGTGYSQAKSRIQQFVPVEIPHDWLISDASKFYEDASGWYRKLFKFRKVKNTCTFLRFEGVYMDSEIYINGEKVMEWKYGYSTFDADVGKYLKTGENEIMVGVCYRTPNSRWYSGAGIYRNVYLITLPSAHIVLDGIYVSTRKKDNVSVVHVSVELSKEARGREMSVMGKLDGMSCRVSVRESAFGTTGAKMDFLLPDAREWDIEHPETYELTVMLMRADETIQTEQVTFGVRTIQADPEQGFLLNGRKLKLNGVCLHHDLGALGAAVNRDAIRRQLVIMKQMGVNAVRTSHNMPAVELMELADEMGILVLSESFDCWELPKTEYDYGRFFGDWWQRDVASWVRRDRNHPSLVFWSIGNEIYDMHAGERGQEITCMLMKEVHRHDPEGNALVTFGSNYMPWENAQKCADIVKIAGYNYSEKYYDEHHEKYRDWVIYGSETSSTVQSRGIYHFPLSQPVLADVDEQCSALGNSTTSWGARNSESCILAERDHPYSMGQFLWSGFDYIGEPTPYHTKNSYFGQVDTAGFAKDSYYLYQAAWTKKPMVHVFPYWDFNEGQAVDVRVCSNMPDVELFVNGRSAGKVHLDHERGERLTADYEIAYERGEITAVAYDADGRTAAKESRHSFSEAAAISLACTDAYGENFPYVWETGGSEISLPVDQKQLLFLEIGCLDADGFPVENATNRVRVNVSGEGRLLGLDNGDSTDYESYQADSRRLFSGKLLAILETSGKPGKMDVSLELVKEETPRVRKIELVRSAGPRLDARHREADILVRVLPEDAAGQSIRYAVTERGGIPSGLAALTEDGVLTEEERAQGFVAKLHLTAKGDGAFRLRAMADNGAPQVRVISELEFEACGIGANCFDPYSFVTAGLYNDSVGVIGSGNDHGIATAREELSAVGFVGVDFGGIGSDEITLPIFELDSTRTPIGIWLGRPYEAGSRLVCTVVYDKPTIWNTYQEETYTLPERLVGICSLYFELHKKIHLKGFSFKRYPKAYERLSAKQNQRVYGDGLRETDEGIMDISNNVTIEFDDMDFGADGCSRVTICGRTANEVTTIHVRFSDGGNEVRQVEEFVHTEDFSEQTFEIGNICGKQTVSFVFMPGSQFDFKWFQFMKK